MPHGLCQQIKALIKSAASAASRASGPEAALQADLIASFSTRIKDAGTAVRHSRRTFSYPQPPKLVETHFFSCRHSCRPPRPLRQPPQQPRKAKADRQSFLDPGKRTAALAKRSICKRVFLKPCPNRRKNLVARLLLLWFCHSRCGPNTLEAVLYAVGTRASAVAETKEKPDLSAFWAEGFAHGLHRH